MRVRALWTALACIAVSCSKPPTPQAADRSEAAPAKQDSASTAAATVAPPPLSAEDIRLIEADPATLTDDEKRKRAYALRRKIMQNPDSPAARTLNDLAKAAREGTIDPHGRNGATLHQPGVKPQGGAPPAGYRPPPKEDPAPKAAP